ncbi:MFS transporter [Actinoplanes sp. G11-F43]|uniref:MFS transporter n=1 Tax=Actinoplanes sp. G11-F43 TaxID=3424130 RepID=UPI003D349E40
MPYHYRIWLGGVALSLLGSQITAFGITWSAAGWGGAFAGAVLTAITLPRVALLLTGGALADRVGAWRVMITADLTMAVATALLGAAVLTVGVQPWLLLGIALVIGTVDAFHLPSSGSMPRLLVGPESLARAMAARQAVGQVAAFAGPSLGGLVVAGAGPAAAAFVNTGTFLVMAVVLIMLRPRVTGAVALPRGAAPGGGLRVVRSDPELRRALGLVAAAAGFLLPVPALLVPLLAIQRQWSADAGGLLAGSVALGMTAVAVTVTVRGASGRPAVAACGGLALAGGAVLGLAAAPALVIAVPVAVLVGAGSGLFAAHIGPLILGGTPETHLARVQSVVVLAQSVPLLVTNNVLGALADRLGAGPVLCACALALIVTAAAGSSRSGRTMVGSDGDRRGRGPYREEP